MSSNQKFRTVTEISHYFKHRDIPANITTIAMRFIDHKNIFILKRGMNVNKLLHCIT